MTKLVKIGSSYGIRIPKALIEKYKLKERNIDLQTLKNGLLITPSKSRANWDSKELRMLVEAESVLDLDFVCEDLNTDDWEW